MSEHHSTVNLCVWEIISRIWDRPLNSSVMYILGSLIHLLKLIYIEIYFKNGEKKHECFLSLQKKVIFCQTDERKAMPGKYWIYRHSVEWIRWQLYIFIASDIKFWHQKVSGRILVWIAFGFIIKRICPRQYVLHQGKKHKKSKILFLFGILS